MKHRIRPRQGNGRKRTMIFLKKTWNFISTILVVAAVLLAILLVAVRLLGYNVYSILSGSMEPTYHVGSVIYVKAVDYRELAVGDPITFMLSEDTVATHRIVEVIPDGEDPETLRFRTKGDANDSADAGLVHYKNVLGKPVFTIPKLGYVADYIQHPPGTYVAMAAGALLILLMFMPELLKIIFSGEESKAQKDATTLPTTEASAKPAPPSASRKLREKTPRPARGGAHSKKGRHEP